MKEKIKWIFIIATLAVIGGGLFYWYEWRPNKIRKECVKIVNSQDDGFNPEKFATEYSRKTYFDEIGYKKCLREKGISE